MAAREHKFGTIPLIKMEERPETSTSPVPVSEEKAKVEGESATEQPAVPTKKKVKTKPDKYHAALKGKMASSGTCSSVATDSTFTQVLMDLGIAGQKGKVKVAGRLLKPVLGLYLLSPYFVFSQHYSLFPEPSYELTFYERAQNPNDELHAIKPYIPNFLGVKELKGQKYLVMEDLLAPYKSPGCIDIKIG